MCECEGIMLHTVSEFKTVQRAPVDGLPLTQHISQHQWQSIEKQRKTTVSYVYSNKFPQHANTAAALFTENGHPWAQWRWALFKIKC